MRKTMTKLELHRILNQYSPTYRAHQRMLHAKLKAWAKLWVIPTLVDRDKKLAPIIARPKGARSST